MATVINVPKWDPWYANAGKGASNILEKKAELDIASGFEEKRKKQFNANLQALQNAGSAQEAFKIMVSGGMAKSPDEVLQYAQAIEKIYQAAAPADLYETPVVDAQGVVKNLRLSADEINDPKKLTAKYGSQYRVASTGEKMQDWYSKDGTFLRNSADRPRDAFTLDELKFNKSKADADAEAKSRRSDIYDETGALKTEAEQLLSRTLDTYFTDQDELGNRTRPDPRLITEARNQALAALQASGNETMPITKAAGDAALAVLQGSQVAFPMTNRQRDEAIDFINEAKFSTEQIDKNLLSVGKATGVLRSGQALVNYVKGQTQALGTDLAFPETEEARRRLAVLERTLQQALVQNARMPVAEQEFVRDNFIPRVDEWFATPAQAAEKLRSLRSYLVDRSQFYTQRIQTSAPGGSTFKPPALGTTSDIINKMPPSELRDVDINLLSADERAALWKKLDELGVPNR